MKVEVAGGLGFEPRLTESESAVLPLNYPPKSSWINSLDWRQGAGARPGRRGACGPLFPRRRATFRTFAASFQESVRGRGRRPKRAAGSPAGLHSHCLPNAPI